MGASLIVSYICENAWTETFLLSCMINNALLPAQHVLACESSSQQAKLPLELVPETHLMFCICHVIAGLAFCNAFFAFN